MLVSVRTLPYPDSSLSCFTLGLFKVWKQKECPLLKVVQTRLSGAGLAGCAEYITTTVWGNLFTDLYFIMEVFLANGNKVPFLTESVYYVKFLRDGSKESSEKIISLPLLNCTMVLVG